MAHRETELRRSASRKCSRLLAAAALLVLLHADPALSQAFHHGTTLELPTGLLPSSVVVADVNNDGILDLVVSDHVYRSYDGGYDPSLSVFLGTGGGRFAPRTSLPAGDSSRLTIADINADGRPDLITGGNDGGVFLQIGDGVGNFGPPRKISDRGFLAVGDLNGDGRPDLVTISLLDYGIQGDLLSTSLGDPSGGFGPSRDFAKVMNATDASLGDLNGNGVLDLMVRTATDSGACVFYGDGTGGFAGKVQLPVDHYPSGDAITDVNDDGYSDLVVTNGALSSASLFLSDGSGQLRPRVDIATAPYPEKLMIADRDADGTADLVTVNDDGQSLCVQPGDGAGHFGTPTCLPITLALGLTVRGSALADLDGDGLLDIVVLNYYSNSLSVLFGNGSSRLGTRRDLPAGAGPSSIAITDANGDGVMDLVVAHHDSSIVSVLLSNGSGGYGPSKDFLVGSGPSAVAFGDLNGDGLPDMAVANSASNTVSILFADGAGGYGAKHDQPTPLHPSAVAIGDVNQDGYPDLVVADSGSNTVSIFPGNNVGGLGARRDKVTGLGPNSIAFWDFNGDGTTTYLATTNHDSNTLTLLQFIGNVSSKIDFATGPGPACVSVGDINGDGYDDLVVANSGASTVSVFLRNATTLLSSRVDSPVGLAARSLALVDMNHDGHQDLVITDGVRSMILIGDGTGHFAANMELPAGVGPSSVAIGDLDGDGRQDVAIANTASGSLSLWLALRDTRTGLTVSPLAPMLGGPFTLDATVTSASAIPATPADSVRFFDGTTLLGTSAVHGGVARLTTIARHPGLRSLSAVYKGDGSLFGSISSTVKTVVSAGGPVPANSSLVSFDAWPDHVALRWLSGTDRAGTATVERRAAGPQWSSLADVSTDGNGFVVYDDVRVTPGATYEYRLSWPNGASHSYSAASSIHVPLQAVFMLGGARPNPVPARDCSIEYSLPQVGRATMELFDVRGRRVAAMDLAPDGGGPHLARFGHVANAGPGIYWARLRQGSHCATARFVMTD